MSGSHLVECEVDVDPSQAFGVFANAFRVQDDDAGCCLLEFLVYSATEQRAKVVAKVPVRRSFLPVIRNSIATCLEVSTSGAGTAFSTSG